MNHVININNIRVYAHHGCLPEETIIGGWYRVDVKISTNFHQATITDNLSDTTDYVLVNRLVKEQMAIPSKLIEHVGQRILTEIKKNITNWTNLHICLTKFNPPIQGDVESVSIEISEENK